MTACLAELHLWTLKDQTLIPESDIGCFTYHDKAAGGATDQCVYSDEKRIYTESRDVTWLPLNKKPDKTRDTLKDFEDLLASTKVILCRWISRQLLQFVISNGAVVTFKVAAASGDVEKLFIDRSLVGKLTSEIITDVIFTDSYMVLSSQEKPKLDYIYFSKKIPPVENLKKIEKLVFYEPKFCQIELPGPSGRRLDRFLSCNVLTDLVLVWWRTGSDEAWPWAPMATDKERANMVLLSPNGTRLDLLTYTRTACNPVDVCFSRIQPYQIFSVEQSVISGGNTSIENCIYETNKSKISRIAVTTVPFKATVISASRTLREDRLVLGCEDKTLVLYDEHRRITQSTKAAVTPNHLKWHPSGTIFLTASNRGEVQMFEIGLAPLSIQLPSEDPCPRSVLDLGIYLKSGPTLTSMQWCHLEGEVIESVIECVDSVILVLDKGPIVSMQVHQGVGHRGKLSPTQFVSQYIKTRQIDKAINVLNSLNWDMEGDVCYMCLSLILNHLLRLPLNAVREGQLERTLGTFYTPSTPLSEIAVLEYRDPISRFARRFFHHLLRFTRFEKAFLLAIDIGSRDLFMDIHYVAADRGETALANAAKRKADQIEATSSCSESGEEFSDEESSEGYSEVSDDYHSGEEGQSQSKFPREVQNGSARAIDETSTAEPSAITFQLPEYNRRDLAEVELEALEEELFSEMMDDFSLSLMEPQERRDRLGDGTEEEADKTSSSVKVIHFGLV